MTGLRDLDRAEVAVLRYLDGARKRGLRVQLDYAFTREAVLRTADGSLPPLACDFLAVRALLEGGHLVWQGPHVYLTGKGKRALRLLAA